MFDIKHVEKWRSVNKVKLAILEIRARDGVVGE